MKPAPLRYVRPQSVAEACAALHAEPEAKVIAGGQSLMPLLNFRLAVPEVLVDLAGIPGLRGIVVAEDSVEVGAMTTQRALERDADALAACPLLALALPHVGHTTTRNRGTVGGSIAHADAAAELPCVLACLDGSVIVAGQGASRQQAAAGLFVTHLTSALAADEVLTAVRFPVLADSWRFAFHEVTQRHGDYAMTMIACAADVVAGRIVEVRIAAGAIADRPLRLTEAEQAVVAGAELGEVRRIAEASIEPSGAPHAPAAYRRARVGALVVRCLEQVLAA